MRAITLALVITGCAQSNAAMQEAKSGAGADGAKDRATAAATTAFSGRWKFTGRCTSKGSPQDCKEFLIINHIPAYMEFYDAGRKVRTLALGGEPPIRPPVATFAEAKLSPELVADSSRPEWAPRDVKADGKIVEPTLGTSYYHLGTDPNAPRYCFGDFCIHYASDGKANGKLDDELDARRIDVKTTPTKHGDVLFGCANDTANFCIDTIVLSQSIVENGYYDDACKGEDERKLPLCPRANRVHGCESKITNPYVDLKASIRVISWTYAGPDAPRGCPDDTVKIKAE